MTSPLLLSPVRDALPSLTSAALTSWMLFSLIVSSLVVLAALAAHDAQRAANRAVRFVWFSAIVVIVALSVAAPLRRTDAPLRRAAAIEAPNVPTVARVAEPSVVARVERALDIVRIPAGAAWQSLTDRLTALPPAVPVSLSMLWLLASVLTVATFALTYARMRRLVRQWPVQLVEDTSARIAPTAGPAVVGLAPTEIVLPSWLLERSAEEQRLVIAHEREHVRARDPWLLVTACAAVALMPWNPALWYALSRLRLAVELDCDRRVLNRGIGAGRYGALLIDLSALRPSASATLPSLSMPAFSCNSSFLERRLVAMTSRPSKYRTSRRFVGGLLALAAVVTACESKLPTSAEIDKMDAAAAETQAKKLALVADGRTEYVVDGQKVSEESAKRIASDKIATVRVKKAAGDAVNEIYITTLDNAKKADVVLDDNASKTVSGVKIRSRQMRGDSVLLTSEAPAKMKKVFDGLLVLDGKIVESSMLDRLAPDRIETIEVVKGAAAQKSYSDPRAVNGVIVVTTKK